MTTLDIYFSTDNGVLRTDDQLLVLPGLARSEFDRGLGQHMNGRKSAPDYVVYGPVSVLLWEQRFLAGVRFFKDVVHGVTLTLEQSRVAALGYDATEKDLLVEKKNSRRCSRSIWRACLHRHHPAPMCSSSLGAA